MGEYLKAKIENKIEQEEEFNAEQAREDILRARIEYLKDAIENKMEGDEYSEDSEEEFIEDSEVEELNYEEERQQKINDVKNKIELLKEHIASRMQDEKEEEQVNEVDERQERINTLKAKINELKNMIEDSDMN